MIVVPPSTHLPRALEALMEVSRLLDKAIEPGRKFGRIRDNLQNDLRLAVLVHAMNALDAS
jgi:hypothetical protein